MAKPTITDLWGAKSGNIDKPTEDKVSKGIQYKGAVVSNELNGLGYKIWEHADNLQRSFTAWNPAKEYDVGDAVQVVVSRGGEILNAVLKCVTKGKNPPFINRGASVFTQDANGSAVVFTISDSGSVGLKHYVSSQWQLMRDWAVQEEEARAKAEVATTTATLRNELNTYKTAMSKAVTTGTLTAGMVTINGNENVKGDLTAGSATIKGATTIGGKLVLNADTQFNKNNALAKTDIYGQLTARANAEVWGETRLKKNVTTDGLILANGKGHFRAGAEAIVQNGTSVKEADYDVITANWFFNIEKGHSQATNGKSISDYFLQRWDFMKIAEAYREQSINFTQDWTKFYRIFILHPASFGLEHSTILTPLQIQCYLWLAEANRGKRRVNLPGFFEIQGSTPTLNYFYAPANDSIYNYITTTKWTSSGRLDNGVGIGFWSNLDLIFYGLRKKR